MRPPVAFRRAARNCFSAIRLLSVILMPIWMLAHILSHIISETKDSLREIATRRIAKIMGRRASVNDTLAANLTGPVAEDRRVRACGSATIRKSVMMSHAAL